MSYLDSADSRLRMGLGLLFFGALFAVFAYEWYRLPVQFLAAPDLASTSASEWSGLDDRAVVAHGHVQTLGERSEKGFVAYSEEELRPRTRLNAGGWEEVTRYTPQFTLIVRDQGIIVQDEYILMGQLRTRRFSDRGRRSGLLNGDDVIVFGELQVGKRAAGSYGYYVDPQIVSRGGTEHFLLDMWTNLAIGLGVPAILLVAGWILVCGSLRDRKCSREGEAQWTRLGF